MTAITSEERSAFFGSFARDVSGNEHLVGLSSTETMAYLAFRRESMRGETVADGVHEHIALYEKHRRACKHRGMEPGE